MSLIPFILDLADEISELSRGIENDFVYANEHRRPVAKSLSQLCYQLPKKLNRLHPYSNACRNKIGVKCNLEEKETLLTDDEDVVVSTVGKKCFQVSMNVKQFKPNELSVKTIDNCVIVEGQHDDKEDGHGLISRHFIRKYTLPKGYDPNEVRSMFSSDGILTVKAPHPQKSEQINERIVQIQQTGPAYFSLKKDSFCGSHDIIAPEEAINNNVASVPKDEVAPSPLVIVAEEQNSKGDLTPMSDAGIGSVGTDTITGNRSGFNNIAQDVESKIEIPLAADDKITPITDYNNSGDVNVAAVAVESIAPSKVNNHDENGEKTATEEISN